MDLFGEEEEQAEVGKYMFAGVEEEEEESATEKEKARPNAVKDEVANGSLFFPERRKQAGRQRTGWAERRAAAEDGVPSLLIQCLDVVALHLDMRNNSNSQMTKRDLEWLPLELKERLVSHLIKYHKLTDENFMACVPSGVGALDLTEALGLTRKSIEAVANTCPRLHTLNLTYCWDISTELMPHLPRLFSNLASLVLDKLTLEPDIVHSLLTNGEQLRSLSLRETETSFSLRAITGLTRLESLTITHEQVTATSDDVAPFNTFLERNTSLRHLNLYMAFHPQKRISYRTSHDDDEYYAGLNFHLATGLLSLDLSHHPILTQQLQEICGQCTDLVSLSLEGCKRLVLLPRRSCCCAPKDFPLSLSLSLSLSSPSLSFGNRYRVCLHNTKIQLNEQPTTTTKVMN
ncbi:hypothetical protein QOT17_001564 [Balamuthia mandrillaris]